MKKVLAIILVLALFAVCLAGCGDKKSGDDAGAAPPPAAAATFGGKNAMNDKFVFAWIPMSTAGQINEVVQKAVDDIVASYPSVTVNFFDAGFNPNTQVSLINDCVTQKYDAILIECADSTAVGPAIAEAEAAGVPVITVNLGCDTLHTLHVKQESYSGGWVSAEALVKLMGGSGDVLLLDVPAWQAVTTTFCRGFEDYCEENAPGINIIEYFNLDGNAQEDAYNVMRDMLVKYDKIDAVYAPDDNYALGIVQAITEAGRQNEGIIVWGTDFQPGGIEAVMEGRVQGSSWSDRYSAMYAAFSSALFFAQTGITSVNLGLTETPSYYVGFTAVTQENAAIIAPFTRYSGY